MGKRRHVDWSRLGALVAVIAMVAGVAPAAAQDAPESDAEVVELPVPEGVEPLDPADDPASPPIEPPVTFPVAEDTPAPPAKAVELPDAASERVTLGGKGQRRQVGATPVAIAAGSGGSKGTGLDVQILDRASAARADVSGFVMRMAAPEGSQLGEDLPVQVSVDYTDFAERYGANWPDRMRVVALPSCALAEAPRQSCSAGQVAIPTRLDRESGELTAEIEDLGALVAGDLDSPRSVDLPVSWAKDDATIGAPVVDESFDDVPVEADGAEVATPADDAGAKPTTTTTEEATTDEFVVLALTSDGDGEAGTYEATPLSLAGDWEVGVGGGDFSWQYPFSVPPAPAGDTPGVSLSYSSGAVDGMVSSRNTQAPQNGVGWADFASAYIQRQYVPCTQDGWDGESNPKLSDRCWKSDNATISLNGRTEELVQVPGSNGRDWVLKDDQRWRVQREHAFVDNNDNDGERWKVTTPDGTQYWFGKTPDSVYYLPVLGDDPGEPCYDGGPAMCNQAWRWNLTEVVDPNGNVTSYDYYREINHYKAILGYGGIRPYVRAGRLRSIEYGAQDGEAAPARIELGAQFRCASLSSDCPAQTPVPDEPGYPDVPTDLICTSSACDHTAPSFFSAKRYTSVTTFVNQEKVDAWTLSHAHLDNGEGDTKLHLTGVQRVDPADTATGLMPPVEFGHTPLANRLDADPAAGVSELTHLRVSSIVDEFGGEVAVTYGQQNPCDPNPYPNGGWDTNTMDCFPQYWVPDEGSAGFGEFHKWLALEVEDRDGTGGSPTMTTTYTYGDQSAPAGSLEAGAGWHDDDDQLVPDGQQSWSDWRGYGTVLVTQGTSKTRYRMFRGMHGDDCASSPDPICQGAAGERTKSVTIASLDDPNRTEADENWLAGRVFDEAQLNGGVTERGVLRDYVWARRVDLDDPLEEPYWVAESETTERRKVPGSTAFAEARTTTSYNAWLFFPERVVEHGWLSEPGDERCTKTGYVFTISDGGTPELSDDVFMLDYPSATTLYEGTSCSGDELRRNEIAYDGNAYGTGPTKGNPTRLRTKTDDSPKWSETERSYDTLGRVTAEIDPNDHTTTTDHTPATGYPATTTVTNPKGHVTTTEWLVGRQVPSKVTDPNGNVTTTDYDGLGRVAKVFQPTEQATGSPPSWEFGYTIDDAKTSPPVVRTRRLMDPDRGEQGFQDSWVVYDSLGRERQKQRLSPATEGGVHKVLVSTTEYESRGLPYLVRHPEAVVGEPGTGVLPAPSPGWANTTGTAYDALGRPTAEIFTAWDCPDDGTCSEQWARVTQMSYTHMSTTMTPARGGRVVTTTDAFDQVVQVDEETTRDSGDWSTTEYRYDLAGDLTDVIDPAGNAITYGYDLAGRRTSMSDPDAGDWTYGYDPAGNQITVTDAEDTTVHTTFDELDRPVARREGSATGPRLATWHYDSAGELGLLNMSLRWTESGEESEAYVVDVLGYDARNRPTGRSWVLYAADLPGLFDPAKGNVSYPVTYSYDRADNVTEVSYPEVGEPNNGGLPAETVTTAWSNLGRPTTMGSDLLPATEDYVEFAGYDDRSRPRWFGFGPNDGTRMNKIWEYDSELRLHRQVTFAAGVLQQDRYISYDKVGNVTKRKTTIEQANGDKTWTDCYGYDDGNRLVRAYSTTHAADCSSADAGSGTDPYDHAYSYSDDGNLTRRIEDGDEANPFVYTYGTYEGMQNPPPHAPPHAPTHLDAPPGGGGDYRWTWDARGNQAQRIKGGTTQDFAWTADGLLDKVVTKNETGSSTSSFEYDADGNRVLRRTVERNTAFIDGHEISATGGGSVSVVRTYTFDGTPVATRTSSGVQYLVTDNQNSVELTVKSGANTPSVDRRYDPYGGKRAGGEPQTNRGYIGQMEDDHTALLYFNARYYDPVMAGFVSPDPLYDLERPSTVNPYAYALDNPTTHEDPSGLCIPVDARETSPCLTSGMDEDTQTQLIQDYQAEKAEAAERREELAEELMLDFEDMVRTDDLDYIGFCVHGEAVLFGGGTGAMCGVGVDGEDAWLFSGNVAAGGEGAVIGTGPMWSNASNVDDLGGTSICVAGGASGVALGGTVTVCRSTSDPAIITAYVAPEVGLGEPGPTSSFSYGTTEIVHEPLDSAPNPIGTAFRKLDCAFDFRKASC